MVTYKKIVVPTDGSENAKRALEHAIAVADRNEAELIIVHVANIVSAISNFLNHLCDGEHYFST